MLLEGGQAALEPLGLGPAVGVAEGEHGRGGLRHCPVPRRIGVRGRSGGHADVSVRRRDVVRPAVGRPVVADHDLELVPWEGLAGEALQERSDVGRSVPDRHDHADPRRDGFRAHERTIGDASARAYGRTTRRCPDRSAGSSSALAERARSRPAAVVFLLRIYTPRPCRRAGRMPSATVRLTVLAAALCVGATAVGQSGAATTPSATWAQTPRAALFVAPGGSDAASCRSRNAACASFERAYRVARPGQIVEVAGGTYRSQSIRAAADEAGPNVVFRPAPRARVVLGGLSFGSGGEMNQGPDRVTVRGMHLAYKGTAPGARNQEGIFVGPGSTNIRLEQMDAGNIHTWFADRVTVLGGDYGPCDAVWESDNVCGNIEVRRLLERRRWTVRSSTTTASTPPVSRTVPTATGSACTSTAARTSRSGTRSSATARSTTSSPPSPGPTRPASGIATC